MKLMTVKQLQRIHITQHVMCQQWKINKLNESNGSNSIGINYKHEISHLENEGSKKIEIRINNDK